MSVLWVIGFGSFTLASLVVGARLLALAFLPRGSLARTEDVAATIHQAR